MVLSHHNIDFTYYYCEPCGHEWKNHSDFVQCCPNCASDNICISALTDEQPNDEAIKEE